MDSAQLLATYAACQQAVSFCELVIGADNWHVMRLLPADAVLDVIRQTINDSVAEAPSAAVAAALGDAFTQADTPDFRRYLAGRLGQN